uniref:Ribosomal protein L14 n=1 Tax=Cafileria marina TaxID=2557541 RepID=A0A5B9ILW3_9STRA|nr:ribosomal protein L14 [Cafileria marina]QEF30253.1 ribosomal protein L14 [Cafileria marina]
MIQTLTKLNLSDNSGAKFTRCIKVLKGFNGKFATIGDIVLVSIKKLRFVRTVKKGEMYFGVVVRTSKEKCYKDGSFSKFKKNSIVLLTKQKKILGSHILCPLSKNLRKKKYMRLLIMSAYRII